jgi:fatty-acid peroxygenase
MSCEGRRPGHRVPVRRARLDNSLRVLAKGYAWLPDKRRALGRRTVATRLGGLPAFGLAGPEAARFLYDEDHVRRAHAIPEPVQGTLFGKGAVHGLDGHAHRVRKAMFVALLMDPGASPRWSSRSPPRGTPRCPAGPRATRSCSSTRRGAC